MIYVDVITGFLGAGKTSFIKQYAQWLSATGESFCVIENEYGTAGVDGAELLENGIAVREISGGCLCCTQTVTMHDYLLAAAGNYSRVIIEPSGIFDGTPLLKVLQSPSLEGKVSIGIWACVVDPISLKNLSDTDLSVLQTEIMFAGSVLLSKTDISTREEKDSAVLCVENICEKPYPVILEISNSEAPNFYGIIKNGFISRELSAKSVDHSTLFQSASFFPKGVYSIESATAFLEKIMICGNVLRIKGVLNAENGGIAVNCTKGCISAEKTVRNTIGINIIGRDLNRAKIKAMFNNETKIY